MAVRLIDGNEFMKKLTLDTSKGFYGEFMDGSDTAYTSREIGEFIEDMPTLTPPNEPLTPCDMCMFSPPSSGDGKPCCMCPAVSRQSEE